MGLDDAEKNRQKSNVAKLSIISNTSLVILKLAVGTMIGSVSVISEAIHSGVDLLAAIIAFFAVRTSGKPADEDHPFGHGKIENISGSVEALLIFLAAGGIILEAIKKLKDLQPLEEAWIGIVVMLISVLANILVSKNLFRVGKATDSIALMADAWHLRTDVYTSLGVFAGLAITFAGKYALPDADLRWIDPGGCWSATGRGGRGEKAHKGFCSNHSGISPPAHAKSRSQPICGVSYQSRCINVRGRVTPHCRHDNLLDQAALSWNHHNHPY
jgi:divalent metal cation (Fe/Co/Zn/Cd) transporter